LPAHRVFVVSNETLETSESSFPVFSPIVDISQLPLPAVDISRFFSDFTPVVQEAIFSGDSITIVTPLRVLIIPAGSRQKILMWLPPNKNALCRKLVYRVHPFQIGWDLNSVIWARVYENMRNLFRKNWIVA